MSDTTMELEHPISDMQPVDDVAFRRRGRPPKSQGSPSPEMAARSIWISVPSYVVEQLHEVAQQELSTISQVVRSAIMTELRRHGLGQPPADGEGIWRGKKVSALSDPTQDPRVDGV